VYSSFREASAKPFFARAFIYFMVITMLAMLTISLFAPEIIFILAPLSYSASARVVPILLLGIFIFEAFSVFTFGIAIAKKTSYRLYFMAIAAGINIGLNFLLIPPYGITGAALATLISAAIYAALSFWISQKLYSVGYNLVGFTRLFLIALGAMIIGLFLLQDINWQNILAKLALIILFIGSAHLFKLIGAAEWKTGFQLGRDLLRNIIRS
jgi:O-antigen/teichoic acid export membrane protein